MSVIKNSQTPESQLKKKNNTICYHAMRESMAMGEMLCAYVRSKDNYAEYLLDKNDETWYSGTCMTFMTSMARPVRM